MPTFKRMSSGALTGCSMQEVASGVGAFFDSAYFDQEYFDTGTNLLTTKPFYVKLAGSLSLISPTAPSGHTIYVANKTTAALALALSSSVVGDTIVFGAGIYPLPNNFVFLEGRTYTGQGIYAQNGGASGTWLKGTGNIEWGANVAINQMLIGDVGASFRPYPRGLTAKAAGAETYANGAHDCTFNFVRYKGGGSNLFPGNPPTSWSGTLQKYDMVDHTWIDCEFECSTVSQYAIFSLWFDCRAGGSQLHDLTWDRCHIGVKNAAGKTGVGSCILIQPGPSEGETGANNGPFTDGSDGGTLSALNANFDWNKIDHGSYNLLFNDCLLEAPMTVFPGGTKYVSINPCDYARVYSTWHGCKEYLSLHPGGTAYTDAIGQSYGWGNPIGTIGNWASIPDRCWAKNVSLTRCYSKGGSARYELGKNCVSANCSGINVSHSGSYGNATSGSFSEANRPHTALFPTDWTTAGYRPSPYDPA